jgi:hypothetical protein
MRAAFNHLGGAILRMAFAGGLNKSLTGLPHFSILINGYAIDRAGPEAYCPVQLNFEGRIGGDTRLSKEERNGRDAHHNEDDQDRRQVNLCESHVPAPSHDGEQPSPR